MEELIEKKWCTHFELLLSAASDHDTREKILISMLGSARACRTELAKNIKLIGILTNLENEYKSLIISESKNDNKDDDADGYYEKIEDLIAQLLKLANSNQKNEL